MANFEYIDEAEAAEEKSEIEGKFSVSGSEGKNYWEELLKDKYQEQKVEDLNVLGKGKRNRTKFLVCHPVLTCISCINLQRKLFWFGSTMSLCFQLHFVVFSLLLVSLL